MSRQIFKDLIVLCLTAVLFAGASAQMDADARIIRGQVTSIDRANYTVQLKNQYGMHSCGGALVTPRHVVTAAHCVEGQTPDMITVVGGATRSDEDGVRQGVQEIIMHPDYTYESGNADVAVLKLNGELSGANIDTIPLCDKYLDNFDFIQVFGWGWTEKEARATDELQTILIPVLDQDYCVEQYKNFHMHINDNMMCAAVPGVTDSCTGDSGGPAVYKRELCGVVSWGKGCGSVGFPGVYTRIVKVRDFIEKNIKM